MPAELRVVAGFHDEAPRQLALQVERPGVVLRKPARVVRLPVRDVAAVSVFGHEERRRRPGRPALVPVERGAGRERRRGHVVAADEAVPVRAAAGVLHRPEGARAAQARRPCRRPRLYTAPSRGLKPHGHASYIVRLPGAARALPANSDAPSRPSAAGFGRFGLKFE